MSGLQTDAPIDTLTKDGQAARHTDTQTFRHTKHTVTQTQRERDQTLRLTDTHRDRYTEGQTDRQTDLRGLVGPDSANKLYSLKAKC
jgi:hypothetical protein